MSSGEIPKRFIRVWLGGRDKIPELFEHWWGSFAELHPDYELWTIDNECSELSIPDDIAHIFNAVTSYASQSDILRVLALYQLGGIYIDADVMPIKSFNILLDDDNSTPFIGMRSSASFETAVIGSPSGHPALKLLIDELPRWYYEHFDRSASVSTGPAFVSHYWFGRSDIRHLPIKTFYPYNGFKAPNREEKLRLFSDINNFPPEMIAAHFSNHRWGGNPNK